MSFPGVSQNPDCGLGEKISECLDVMEGAWNLLYQEENYKSGTRAKQVVGPARKQVQESLGDFHGRLVLDSNMTINIAVFGTEGAGKSTLLNFLLNEGTIQGVPSDLLNEGPLPSGKGTRQTRLPIYVNYANSVQVLLHKNRDELKPEVLFPNSELEAQAENSLTTVRDCLKKVFQKEDVLEDATHIELQGPFSIFPYLEERKITSSNHLELKVNVKLVDLPGLREDQKGDKVLISELSKADLILFFTSGQEGREVTPHDLANVFRQHGNFDFPSRPKLIHVVKASASDNFDVMHQVNQGVLENVWKEFFDDVEGNKCYKLSREKLPSLGGEDLLNKLKEESEVLVFHPDNEGFLAGLKDALSRHIKNVKTKKAFHPSLKELHRIAKNLNKTIPSSASRAKKAPQDFRKVTVENPPFEIIPDEKEKEDLIESFLATDEEDILQQEDIEEVYKDFMYADETSRFVQERLQIALNNVSDKLITSVENGYRNASLDFSDILRALAEMFCNGKVQRYCAHRALRYFHWFLQNFKVCKPTSKERKTWSTYRKEDRKGLLTKFLVNLLGKVLKRLETARGCGGDISPLKVREFLKNGIEELFSVRSLEKVPSNPKVLKGKLQQVIDFSRKAIRECNPEFDLSSLDSYDHTKDFPEQIKMRSIDNSKSKISCAHERIIKEMVQLLKSEKGDPVRELEKKLKFEKSYKALAPPMNVDPGKWPFALLTVLSDKDHFAFPLDDDFALDDKILTLARKRLFAFRRSRVECQIVKTHSIPSDEIRVQKHTEQPNVLQASMTSETQKDLDRICTSFTDCKTQLAPIFIPTIRPGPQQNRMGNYFLQEDPWKTKNESESETENVDESALLEFKEEGPWKTENESENETENVDESALLEFNIFLVVEERHLEDLKSTIEKKTPPADRKINLKYIVLPQNGRGIGVTRAIIKSLAECFKFDLYWTIDDDIKFMYQFNENDRRWHKCTFGRGLLFGQRVFQDCRQPALKQLQPDVLNNLVDDALDLWPRWAKKSRSRREARSRLVDEAKLQKLMDSPGLLHSPFTDEIISEDCGEDDAKKKELKEVERKFVEECRSHLFEDAINHIAGVSLAHKSTGKSDYMGNYPSSHYMRSTQRYQVVLHNAPALKGMNYVTDEMIFLEQENQITEKERRNTGYYGIRHCDKSFSRALEVSGIFGYQVICIHHVHKKGLVNAYEAIGPSYEDSMSPYASEEEV